MPEKPRQQLLMVVDGNALLHRAWHALPPLTDRRGRVVNAVYGFLSTLMKAVADLAPTHLVVAFDRPGKTFRHEAYAEYKATRVKQPDELYAQIPILEEVLAAFRIPVLGEAGYEADDVLGTVAAAAERAKGTDVVIVTGDLDTLQLVSPRTSVLTLRKGITDTVRYDTDAVRARFGLEPSQMIDYKALRGDPSDNIKGVPGIGEKTASELLRSFGSIEGLYAALRKGSAGLKPGVEEKLRAGEKDAALAKDLVTIRRDLKIGFSLAEAAIRPAPRDTIVEAFGDLGFQSLLKRIPDALVEGVKDTGNRKEGIGTEAGGRREESRLGAKGEARSAKREPRTPKVTDAPWTITEAVEATAWAKKAGDALTIVVGDEPSIAVLDASGVTYLHGVFAVRAAKAVLEDPKRTKVTHDAKNAMKTLRSQGIALAGVTFDTMLADYLLAPGSRSHTIGALSLEHLREELPEAGGQGTLLAPAPVELATAAAARVRAVARTAPILAKELDRRNQSALLTEMELPLAGVLADMERAGVKIDTTLLMGLSVEFDTRITKLERSIWKDAGEEFNVSSPQQLGVILFEKLRIPSERIKKTATGGALSTAASELEKLRDLHPIVGKIFEYRELTKLKGTYVDALPALADKKTHRVHTTYNQTAAATGRLSSSDPGLQNIPIRTEIGREIRKAFIADRGNRLVAADYAQIELRLAAVIAGAKGMLAAFRKGEDIHTRTAAAISGIAPDKVTPDQRRAAKAVNFGIIYGMGAQGLSQGAGIPFAEAKEFIRKYFEANPEIREYMDLTKALAAKQGYVETVFGRRRYLPEIVSGMPQLRASAERMAINHPIQGTEADLVKLAMINTHAKLAKKVPAAKLILSVHDELVVECPEKDVAAVAKLLKEEMENAHKFPIPMTVETKSGKNWGEMTRIS